MSSLPTPRPVRRRRIAPRSLAILAATIALLAAACGGSGSSATPGASAEPTPGPTTGSSATPGASPTPSSTGTPVPSGEAAAIYGKIEDQVIAERGLPATQRITPTTLSEAEVKARIAEQFRKDNPPDELAVAEGTMKALGLLPADADLGQLYVDLLGSQVAGFYDPRTKEMVVVSRTGSIGGTEKTTFAHEFTHALQDQNFGLDGIDVDAVGQGDRSLGRLALVEGDATLLMTRWLAGHLTPAEIRELLQVDPEAQAQLERMPAILRETLLFPYQQGLIFVNGIWAKGGWEAVDRAYGALPDSTEQVLHPAKYEAHEKPVDVPLDGAALAAAMGPGWSTTPEDTLGEFQLSVWLRENGVKALDAQKAAEGWGGDRLAYLRGPNGAYALALLTAWDTQADADEFLAVAPTAAAKLPGAAEARVSQTGADRFADHVEVLVASDPAALAALRSAVDSLP
jgi:hypothetical protein